MTSTGQDTAACFGRPVPRTAYQQPVAVGSGRGGTSFTANQRFGRQVDGVSISEAQVRFAKEQAAPRGVADYVGW
jgi:hypothetical protein